MTPSKLVWEDVLDVYLSECFVNTHILASLDSIYIFSLPFPILLFLTCPLLKSLPGLGAHDDGAHDTEQRAESYQHTVPTVVGEGL